MSFQIPTTTTAATKNFSFGLPQTTGASVTAAKPPAFVSLGAGDAGTGIKPLTAVAPATSLPSLAPAPATNLTFGAAASTGATTTQTTAPNFSFSTPAATTATSFAPSTALGAPKPTASLSLAPTTTTTSFSSLGNNNFTNLSTVTKTTDSAQVSTASQLSYHQLEEHINKWTLELEDQEKVFTDQATQINAWDKMLIANNEKILELNEAVQKVKSDQQTLEQELEFISTQHKELEDSILPLQKELGNLPSTDVDRSLTYMLVENLDTQLKQMSEDLKEIIDNLNEANKGQDNADPIMQIGKILNAHMSSLQWIETSSTNISNKLEDLHKMHENFKRESERSFRSAYYN